jgi:uncharacterized protein (TIGR00369 family)
MRTAEEQRAAPDRAERQSTCFVCGPGHPTGLRVRFRREADGSACAAWAPQPAWEGFRGIVHGGIVSTLLDEAMSKAVSGMGREALTAELTVRFHLAARTGQTLEIRGWVVESRKRLIRAEGSITAEGVELAHAHGVFLGLPGSRSAVTDE